MTFERETYERMHFDQPTTKWLRTMRGRHRLAAEPVAVASRQLRFNRQPYFSSMQMEGWWCWFCVLSFPLSSDLCLQIPLSGRQFCWYLYQKTVSMNACNADLCSLAGQPLLSAFPRTTCRGALNLLCRCTRHSWAGKRYLGRFGTKSLTEHMAWMAWMATKHCSPWWEEKGIDLIIFKYGLPTLTQ